MLVAPSPTPYDWRFRLLGMPVRVSPWFWVVMLMLSGAQKGEVQVMAVFVACAFVSILVHEFGHGLTSRATGVEPTEIVLYQMGGLCCSEPGRQSPLARFLVIAAGPSAGFALLAIVLAIAKIQFGVEPLDTFAFYGIGPGKPANVVIKLQLYPVWFLTLEILVFVNLIWGLLNLLPIWPLDGGQMTEILLGGIDRRSASRWTHMVSLLTAGGLALWFGTRPDPDLFRALFFAYFAFMNYQRLQSLHQMSRYGDDERW